MEAFMSRHLLVALGLAVAAAGCKATVTARTGTAPRRPVAERHESAPPPYEVHEQAPPPVAAPDYAAQGWTLLGEKWVEGKNDHDVINVGGRKHGTWTALMMSVEGSDMKLNDVTVVFG